MPETRETRETTGSERTGGESRGAVEWYRILEGPFLRQTAWCVVFVAPIWALLEPGRALFMAAYWVTAVLFLYGASKRAPKFGKPVAAAIWGALFYAGQSLFEELPSSPALSLAVREIVVFATLGAVTLTVRRSLRPEETLVRERPLPDE